MAASLEQLLADAIESQTRDLWTSLPARVTAWSGGTTPKVTVQPFPATYLDGEPVALPELGDVPVCYAGGAGGGIVYPLQAGDVVLLVFSSLPVGQFRNSGSEGDPGEIRHHDLSDAFALPLRCAGAGPSAAAGVLAVVRPTSGKVKLGTTAANRGVARLNDTTSNGSLAIVAAGTVPPALPGVILTFTYTPPSGPSQIQIVTLTGALTGVSVGVPAAFSGVVNSASAIVEAA